MYNYYELLGIECNATSADIKKAFREKAKLLHPDIAGKSAEDQMRRLLTAYETLSNEDRRYEYDRAYSRFVNNFTGVKTGKGFDYRTWLREQGDDPENQAKLIFFELLHLEEDEAINIWRKNGGIDFPMEKYLDREDWMDCTFILAEELDKRAQSYDAFRLLAQIIREERKQPYFRHFTPEIEKLVREIVRLRLKSQIDTETWIECIQTLLGLEFPARDEYFWLLSLARTLRSMDDFIGAENVAREAAKRGNTKQRKKQKSMEGAVK